MKINLVSDLHLEFEAHPFEHTNHNNADYLFLAGDICGYEHFYLLDQFLKSVSGQYKQIFYVTGNHEYYGCRDMSHVDLSIREMLPNNVVFLNTETVKLEKYTIIGGTLWTDLSNPIHSYNAKQSMNDYRCIGGMSPALSTFLHNEMVSLIDATNVDNIIVLGHHLPSFQSVAPQYAGSDLNHAFATDLEYLMERKNIPLWIHGHTHTSYDYSIGNTRVVCNPKGYRKENQHGFCNLKEIMLD